ncbi:hypothetical protein [Inquilinus sp.]|jgi:hypothetical protein|uniref:hypothetical protein n=1 Tax=Inquilinus sp. TaxID=1932117 RepID=UPI0037836FAB
MNPAGGEVADAAPGPHGGELFAAASRGRPVDGGRSLEHQGREAMADYIGDDLDSIITGVSVSDVNIVL